MSTKPADVSIRRVEAGSASENGSRWLAGGAGGFATVDGQARTDLAAVNVATGAVTTWNPNVQGVQVWSLAATNDTLYVAGDYSHVGGQSRVCLAAVTLSTGALLGWAPSAFGPAMASAANAPASSHPTGADSVAALKMVIIVGPAHSSTSSFLSEAEGLAKLAESYGMDVRRVFHPNATAERVLQHIQGANIVAYFGHGNGWPSPYAPFQEKTKNGFGLNPFEGSSASNHKYYGGKLVSGVLPLIAAFYVGDRLLEGLPAVLLLMLS